MDGIIALWKERGMTSHDCVFKLRKILHMKKIGHGGTLDPDVDGVLPICIGKGTKVIEYLQDNHKIYEGEITLGFSTTTEDVSGEIVEQVNVTAPLTVEVIDQAMSQMVGTITQIPPMYSAVKVKGKRLYEYAREGLEVERPMRKADIFSFERTSVPVFDEEKGTQSWRFKVICGKGTYVRTLSVDTGSILGYPAHMSDLTRTASGGLSKENALTLDEIKTLVEQKSFEFVQPIERAFDASFTCVDLSEEQYQLVKNGVFLSRNLIDKEVTEEEPIPVFYQGQVVGIYQVHPRKNNLLKPTKIIRNDQ
ncbi:tRNA pseudouridine(55) synthase TruB [Vagococcus xieshaowenii]|uniref:tRNA pseudouridine synthase B n=1 Tax=Vagococcus xieshaowenii TaxID=2562451 RepID=A0A4Z0DDI2_9ENTE|nr:tRNA pseudouridine(55) synthase TruB [Vagococcus xieshaowenii]QCA28775.1 tRNA pseudouridine(55) synthase TruB [Vagococcus xieshaowenii]TFZ43024.1 tRNA pseudouridine(55) synthase TruB [Vagococcus xieshaowenii]